MEFLKENLPKIELIYKKEVQDKVALEISRFYKESPFPNFKSNDNDNRDNTLSYLKELIN